VIREPELMQKDRDDEYNILVYCDLHDMHITWETPQTPIKESPTPSPALSP